MDKRQSAEVLSAYKIKILVYEPLALAKMGRICYTRLKHRSCGVIHQLQNKSIKELRTWG